MFVVMQKDPGRAFYGKNRPRAPPASRSLCLAPTEAVKRVCPQSPGREEPGWGVHALTHACFPGPFGGLLRGALGETSLLRLNLLSQLPPSPCRQVPGQFGAFSACSQLRSHHALRLQDPLIPERQRPPAAAPRAPPPAPDNRDLLPVSLESPFLDTSYARNHITRGLWSGLFYGAQCFQRSPPL